MDKRIVFKNTDGSCGIIIPAPKARFMVLVKERVVKETKSKKTGKVTKKIVSNNVFKPETDLQFLTRIAEKDVPFDDAGKQLPWRIVAADKIPTDRTFRAAWTDHNDTDTVDVDMTKARDIHMNRIRAARDIKLAELDIQTLRGRDVQKEKQIYRDIPQTFDLTAAKSPEDLAALWPKQLQA